jgi:6-phospho-beta-glucosidase
MVQTMKAVFVGGGSLRLLGIIRGALAERGIFEGGEINLYDLHSARAEAMGRMILKSPEYQKVKCKITWGTSLAEALDGANMVGVILMAGSDRSFQLGGDACYRHGFVPSDNVSPNGAFLAIKGAPIFLDLARHMKKYCPNAWLVDFANPVAVLSGMINNHTPIKAIGVCAGYTNHQWDLSRMLGHDDQGTDFDVDVAGINHLSFILNGTVKGKDLFKTLHRKLSRGWKMPALSPTWPKAYHKTIPRGIATMIRFFKELDLLIFSSEGDGMMHLNFDEVVEAHLRKFKNPTAAQQEKILEAGRLARRLADKRFQTAVTSDLDPSFWTTGWQQPGYDWAQRQDRDIFVEVLRGLSGVKKVKVVTSRLNNGAVVGFSDRTVLEYSQTIENGEIKPSGRYEIPPVAQGLIASLAAHQTMLGDALAANDPRMLGQALLSYPVKPFSRDARELYKELAAINSKEMPASLRHVGDYL